MVVHLSANYPTWHCLVWHVLFFSCISLPIDTLQILICQAGYLVVKEIKILRGLLGNLQKI